MCCLGEVIKFQNKTTMQLNWFYTLSITRRAIYVECNSEARSCGHCCSGKAINITYSESVCLQSQVCGVNCACATLSSVASPALQSFSTLTHKRHDFRKMLLNIKFVCWFSVQRLSETSLILRRTEPDMMKYVHWSSCKMYLLFLFGLNEN